MKPGPELDALVHEHVFQLCNHVWVIASGAVPGGWHHNRQCSKCAVYESLVVHVNTPPYSTDIAAAWGVMEHLRRGGWLLSILPEPRGTWWVTPQVALNPRGDGTAEGWDDTLPECTFRTQTVMHGICLAAVEHLLGEEVLKDYVVCRICQELEQAHAESCLALREWR